MNTGIFGLFAFSVVLLQASNALCASEINPVMPRKEALSLVSSAEKEIGVKCKHKDASDYPCLTIVSNAVVAYLHLSEYKKLDELLKFKVNSDKCYKYMYSTGKYSDNNLRIFSFEKNAVSVFVNEKLARSQNRGVLINSYLCSFAIAGGRISNVQPNVAPGYFQNSDEHLALIRKHLGDAEAETADRFFNEILLTYVVSQYKIYQKNINNNNNFKKLNLELALNAQKEVNRQGYPNEYIQWVDGMVAVAKNSM